MEGVTAEGRALLPGALLTTGDPISCLLCNMAEEGTLLEQRSIHLHTDGHKRSRCAWSFLNLCGGDAAWERNILPA